MPAIGALDLIGEPCIDAVIGKLCNTDCTLEHEACTAVLWKLRDHPAVREKLQQALPKVLPRRRFTKEVERALKSLVEKPFQTRNKDLLRGQGIAGLLTDFITPDGPEP